MKTIRDYIDSLFLGITETSQIKQLKEDLLANAEDKYEDLKKQGKTENEAIGNVIAEFGSIDELLSEMNLKQEFMDEKGYELNEVSLDESIHYLNIRRRGATQIGLGVMFIILGLAAMFVTMGVLGEKTGEGFGMLFFFLGTAIGVPLFIIAGLSMSNVNKQLDDRFIPISVKNEMKKRKEAFQRSFIFCMVAGVSLCILALAPMILFIEVYDEEFFGIACLLVSVSFGVFFFIFGGVIMGGFKKMTEYTYFISDEDKLGPKAKAERNRNRPGWLLVLERVYWPTIVGIFLVQGFLLGNWGTNWTIFPVAGILFWVIESYFGEK